MRMSALRTRPRVAKGHTAMNLRPLKDRVLIRPEVPSDTTPSGLILAEHRKPEQTGTVLAVGITQHPLKMQAEAAADLILQYFDMPLDCEDESNVFSDAARLLRALVR